MPKPNQTDKGHLIIVTMTIKDTSQRSPDFVLSCMSKTHKTTALKWRAIYMPSHEIMLLGDIFVNETCPQIERNRQPYRAIWVTYADAGGRGKVRGSPKSVSPSRDHQCLYKIHGNPSNSCWDISGPKWSTNHQRPTHAFLAIKQVISGSLWALRSRRVIIAERVWLCLTTYWNQTSVMSQISCFSFALTTQMFLGWRPSGHKVNS